MDKTTILNGQTLEEFDYRSCISSDIVPVCLLSSEVPTEYTPEVIVTPQDGNLESLKCSICDRIALSPTMRTCGCVICCRCDQQDRASNTRVANDPAGDNGNNATNISGSNIGNNNDTSSNNINKVSGNLSASLGIDNDNNNTEENFIDTRAQKFCTVHGEVYGPVLSYEAFPRNLLKLLSCTLIRCPFDAVGCVAEISLLRYQEHVKNCPFSAVRCPYCLSPGLREHFADKHYSICTCLPSDCPVCRQRIPVGDLPEHLQQNHPVCEFCKQLKATPHDPAHTVRQCGVGGCVEVVARCQFNSHLRDAAFSHIHCDRLITDLSDVRHELDQTYSKLNEATIQIKTLTREASLATRLKKLLLHSFREKERCLIVYGSTEVALDRLVGVLKTAERVVIAKNLLEYITKVFGVNDSTAKTEKNIGVLLASNIFIDKSLNIRVTWPTRSSQVPDSVRALQGQGLPPHIIAIHSLSLLFDGTLLEVSNMDDLAQVCLAENDEDALKVLAIRGNNTATGAIQNTKYGHSNRGVQGGNSLSSSASSRALNAPGSINSGLQAGTVNGTDDWIARSNKLGELYGFNDNSKNNVNTGSASISNNNANTNNTNNINNQGPGNEQVDAYAFMNAIINGTNNTNDNWEKLVYQKVILQQTQSGSTNAGGSISSQVLRNDAIESRLNDPAIFAVIKEIGVFMAYLVTLYAYLYNDVTKGGQQNQGVGANATGMTGVGSQATGAHNLWLPAIDWLYSTMFEEVIKHIYKYSNIFLPTYVPTTKNTAFSSSVGSAGSSASGAGASTIDRNRSNDVTQERRHKHSRRGDFDGRLGNVSQNDKAGSASLSDIYGFNISTSGSSGGISTAEVGSTGKSDGLNGGINSAGENSAAEALREKIRNALKYGDALGLPIAKWTSSIGRSQDRAISNMITNYDSSSGIDSSESNFHSYYFPSADKDDIIDPEILDSYDFVFYTPTFRIHKIVCYAFKQCLPNITSQFNPTAIVIGSGTAIMYLRNLIPRNIGSITFESNRSYTTDEGVAISDAIHPCSQNLHEINLISHTYDVHSELNTTSLSEALADSVHSLSTVTMTRQRLGSRTVDSLSTVLSDCYCLRSLVFDECEICPLAKLGQAFVNLSSLSVLILKLNAVDSRKKLFDADLPRFLATLSYLRSLNKLVINLSDEITITNHAAISLRESLMAMQSNLLHLEMCQCGIKFDVFTIILNALEGMKKLKILRIDSNPLFVNEPAQFIGMVVDYLSKITTLAELSLVDTRLTSPNLCSFVETLFGNNLRRTRAGAETVGFEALQILRLDRNRLRDEDGKQIHKLLRLPNLALISFKYCKDFTVDGLKALALGIQKESYQIISEKLSSGKKIRIMVEIFPLATETMQSVGFVVKDGMYVLTQLKN